MLAKDRRGVVDRRGGRKIIGRRRSDNGLELATEAGVNLGLSF